MQIWSHDCRAHILIDRLARKCWKLCHLSVFLDQFGGFNWNTHDIWCRTKIATIKMRLFILNSIESNQIKSFQFSTDCFRFRSIEKMPSNFNGDIWPSILRMRKIADTSGGVQKNDSIPYKPNTIRLKRVFQILCGIFQHFGTFASSTLNAQSPWLNSYCPPLFLWLLRRAMLACFSYRLLFNRETFREFRYSHPVRRRTFIVIAIRFQLLNVVLLIFCCFCCCVTACVEY